MGVEFFCDYCGAVASEQNPIYRMTYEKIAAPNLDGAANHNNKMACQKCLDRLRIKPTRCLGIRSWNLV